MMSSFQKTSWKRHRREEQVQGMGWVTCLIVLAFAGFKGTRGHADGGVHQRSENPCLDIGTQIGTKDTDLGVDST